VLLIGLACPKRETGVGHLDFHEPGLVGKRAADATYSLFGNVMVKDVPILQGDTLSVVLQSIACNLMTIVVLCLMDTLVNYCQASLTQGGTCCRDQHSSHAHVITHRRSLRTQLLWFEVLCNSCGSVQSCALKCLSTHSGVEGCALKCGQSCALKCGQSCALKCLQSCALKCGQSCALKCGQSCALKCLQSCALKCGQSCALKCGQSCALKCLQNCALKCGQSCALKCCQSCALKCCQSCALECGQICALKCLQSCALKCGQSCALECGQSCALKCLSTHSGVEGCQGQSSG